MTRSPALRAALAFAAGILLEAYGWRPPLWWAAAAVVCCAAAAVWLRRRPRLAQVAALTALAALGALAAGGRDGEFRTGLAQRDVGRFIDGEPVVITAHVARDGVLRGPQRQVVDIETEQVGPAARTARVRLTLYTREPAEDDDEAAGTALPVLRYGQRLRFTGRLRQPGNFGNPGAWDYRSYLAGHGITALATARADQVELLPGFAGGRFALWTSRARRSVLAHVHTLWDGPRAALLDAMLVGDTAGINRDTRVAFQRTGVYHILVVSGMNVSILAFVIFWVLRRVRVSEVVCSALTVLLSLGYACLADLGAPILRATLMLAIYLGTRLLYRERALVNAVGASALILLAADPRSLFDGSFQLTFLSVLAIAGIGVPLLERTTEPYRRALRNLDQTAVDATLAPRIAQFRLDLRLLRQRVARLTGDWPARFALLGGVRTVVGIYEVLLISVVAQLGLALPMAIDFHRATVLGLPANAIVVPLTGVLMPAAAIAVGLAYIAPWLAKPAVLVTTLSLDAIRWVIRVLGGLSAAEWRVPAPSLMVSLAAAAAFVFCIWAMTRRRLLAATGLALLLMSAVWLALAPPRAQWRPGALEMTAIDVGQADATLIVTPEGRTLLVDAAGSLGPSPSEFDFGEDVISPYLWSRGLTRLDAVALTHAHADHMGGMASVIANFRPRELWLGPNAATPALLGLMRTASARQVAVVRRQAGEKFTFGSAAVRVLSPPRDWPLAAKVRNNDSMVLEISYHGSAILLEGDAETKMERMFVAEQPRATLLKVAHNGSATSSSPELLEALRPRWAVISVGRHNSFRHPRPEVLQRLAALQVATYRTDTAGAVSFYLDGEKVTPVLPARAPRISPRR